MLIYSWKLTAAAVGVAFLMSLSAIVFLPTLQQKTRDVLITDTENSVFPISPMYCRPAPAVKLPGGGATPAPHFSYALNHPQLT